MQGQLRPARDVRAPPHDLHEAARRGSLADVKRHLRRSASADGQDMFGYTPLAWAVVRDRPDVIKTLLKAGADPYPGLPGYSRPWMTPLWLGSRLGQGDTVRLMLARLELRSIQAAASDFITAAVDGSDAPTLRTLITSAPLGYRLDLPYERALSARRRDLLDILVASEHFRADDLLAAAVRIGDLEGAKLAISKGADVNGKDTPIEQAVLGVHAADEPILEALIQAGADLNRTTVGGGPSTPPLRVAVERAYRGPFDNEWDRRTAERQQRIIMRLVEQGARGDTRSPEQVPLAFVAILGVNAVNDPSGGTVARPLPGDVLRGLVRAGMDLNETYRGRTVLGWVQAAQPASPLVDVLRSMGARDTV